MTTKPTDFVGSLAKGLRVIEAFGHDSARLAIAQVSEMTGLDRATSRRSLLTLHELGYADYDGKFFSLARNIGAKIIGGCCGTTPDHLRAMREALETRPVAAEPPKLAEVEEKLGGFSSESDGTHVCGHGHAPKPRERRGRRRRSE